jgi:hypothetical protein
MNSEKNQQILISTIAAVSSRSFTVTEIRNKLLKDSNLSSCDPAKTRRWIAGKFITFERWGWLEKETDEIKNRDYFKVLPKFHEDLERSKKEEADLLTPYTSENSDVFMCISKELEQYRKTIITQMSEIEEYKRIEHTYPELKNIATHRFQLVRDENYRLLGKMKALEHLINNSEDQSHQ